MAVDIIFIVALTVALGAILVWAFNYEKRNLQRNAAQQVERPDEQEQEVASGKQIRPFVAKIVRMIELQDFAMRREDYRAVFIFPREGEPLMTVTSVEFPAAGRPSHFSVFVGGARCRLTGDEADATYTPFRMMKKVGFAKETEEADRANRAHLALIAPKIEAYTPIDRRDSK